MQQDSTILMLGDTIQTSVIRDMEVLVETVDLADLVTLTVDTEVMEVLLVLHHPLVDSTEMYQVTQVITIGSIPQEDQVHDMDHQIRVDLLRIDLQ